VTAPSLDPKKLLEGTTPGPWFWDGRFLMGSFPEYGSPDKVAVLYLAGVTQRRDSRPQIETEDAALVAAAPDLARRLAEREERLKQEERFKFAANKRAEKLATLLRKLMEAHEWHTSLAEPGSPLDKLTKRASAALAKGEG
jgi:hypothetical protein